MTKGDFWKRHIEQHGQSGLSKVDYCRREKITVSTFDYWRSKLRSASAINSDEKGFVAIGPRSSEPGVTIELTNGAVLRVSDLSVLGEVLKVLGC